MTTVFLLFWPLGNLENTPLRGICCVSWSHLGLSWLPSSDLLIHALKLSLSLSSFLPIPLNSFIEVHYIMKFSATFIFPPNNMSYASRTSFSLYINSLPYIKEISFLVKEPELEGEDDQILSVSNDLFMGFSKHFKVERYVLG